MFAGLNPYESMTQLMTDFKQLNPAWDVTENSSGFMVQMELPGLNKEDIKVEFKDGKLTISGEMRREKVESNEYRHRSERQYGKFLRSLTVPGNVSAEEVKASYSNGLLKVSFPKRQVFEPKTSIIQIQ